MRDFLRTIAYTSPPAKLAGLLETGHRLIGMKMDGFNNYVIIKTGTEKQIIEFCRELADILENEQ